MIRPPVPVPLRSVGELAGLAEGEWFAQPEPKARAVWTPGAGLCWADGARPVTPEELALIGAPEGLLRVTCALELGILGRRQLELRVLDVALRGNFHTRIEELLKLWPAAPVRFRWVHNVEDVNRALTSARRQDGAPSILLKRWDASYPASTLAAVPWLACRRVRRQIPVRAGKTEGSAP